METTFLPTWNWSQQGLWIILSNKVVIISPRLDNSHQNNLHWQYLLSLNMYFWFWGALFLSGICPSGHLRFLNLWIFKIFFTKTQLTSAIHIASYIHMSVNFPGFLQSSEPSEAHPRGRENPPANQPADCRVRCSSTPLCYSVCSTSSDSR